MRASEKKELEQLKATRRRINASKELRPELDIEERARRVAEYARQVAEHGEIVEWLPPAEPRTPAHRSRFEKHGDALRARGLARVGPAGRVG